MREYELIHECQYGVHYKRWVRILTRAQYCGCDVFLYRNPAKTGVVTHLSTGSIIVMGRVSPYPAAVVSYLDQTLTEAQRNHLRRLSGRLVKAYLYSQLCGLPTYREAKRAIAAKREELYRLEEIITGGGLPF